MLRFFLLLTFSNFLKTYSQKSIFNKPGTIAALSALNGGGFSQTISANALRNSHTKWSFSKADRFPKTKFQTAAKFVSLPTTRDTKSSSFGLGTKQGLKMFTGRDSPPPTSYQKMNYQFDKTKGTGFSFGLPYSAYKKVHYKGINTGAEDVPGPGNYDQKTTLGANSCKFSFKSRIKPQDATTRNYPPPNCYDPEHSLTEQHRFNAITFGIGGRANVNGRLLDNPGPGSYRIPSVFDKFKRLDNVTP